MTHTTINTPVSPKALVEEAVSAGLLLYAVRGQLRVHGGELRPDLLAQLKQYRDDVLEYLHNDLIRPRALWGVAYTEKLEALLAEVKIPQHIDWRFWELLSDALGAYTWWGLEGMTPDQKKEASKFTLIPPQQLEEVKIKALAKWLSAAEAREQHSYQMLRMTPPAYAYSEEDGRRIGVALDPAWLARQDELGGNCFKWAWRCLLASVLEKKGDIEQLDTRYWLAFLGRHVKRWEAE